jgi:hypothetical protein
MDEMLKKHLQVEFDHITKTIPDFLAELKKYLEHEENDPLSLQTENMRLMAYLLKGHIEHIEDLCKMDIEWKLKEKKRYEPEEDA